MDLNRLSSAVAALDHKEPDVALFYSKPSQVYDNGARVRLWQTYRNLITCGLRVGIVSDRSIENLSKYKILVIPRAYNCKAETLAAVNEFIKNGGKVFMQTGSFAKDEYNQKLDNSYLTKNADTFYIYTYSTAFSAFQKYFENIGKLNIKVCGNDGTIPEGIEWETAEKNGALLVNITSISDDTEGLHVERNGEILNGATDLITQNSVGETFTVKQYTPMLLQFGREKSGIDPSIISIWSENQVAEWETKGDADGARIYKITKNGLSVDGETLSNSYPVQDSTIFVRPMDYDKKEYGGAIISVFDSKPIELAFENITDGKTNAAYTLSVRNSKNVPVKCVAEITFSDGENVSKQVFLDLMLKAGETSKIQMNTVKTADIMKAAVWDNLKSKRALAESITYDFNNKPE